MTVKARWHQTELALDGELPFDSDEPERIERVGTPIELTGSVAELNQQLVDTLAREGALYERDITCQIKDKRDTSCHACPLYLSDGSPAAQLCAIGREQERLITLIAIRGNDGRRR